MLNKELDYDKWRKLILRTCLMIAGILLGTEIAIFFIYRETGRIEQTVPVFLLRFLILPTIIDFTTVFIGKKVLYSKKVSEEVKNYASVMMLAVICMCMAWVHYIFPPIMCDFSGPIVLTTIFSNKKMTKFFLYLGYFSVCVSGFIASLESRANDPSLIYDCMVAMIILWCSGIIGMVLIQFQEERRQKIQDGYLKQISLSEKLKRDSLTGLYNYNAFFEIISHYFEQKKELNLDEEICLAVIDIDNFKQINDTYGHEKGNEIIITLSCILSERVKNNGYVARYGGEEFAIFLIGEDYDCAAQIMEEIRREFGEYEFPFLKDRKVTISVGAVVYGEHITDSKAMFELADQVMYQAKRTGKNKVIIKGSEEYARA